MRALLRLWLVVALSYVAARYAVRVFAAGMWRVDEELLTHMLIVPPAQVAVLEVLRRLTRRRLP
jgi:hypothetical protein